MAKGVKKIKWTGKGRVISSMSTPNKKVVIAADQEVFFEVDLWYEGTTEIDKKKVVTWILQDRKKNTIILQRIHSANAPQRISIPKALCGPFEYYIEASLSGERDLVNQTGLLVSGYCPAKIVSTKWCTTNDGKDVGKEHQFNYGEMVFLNLMTEGLNGHLHLSIDVFRKSDDKKPLHRYTSVDVIDGEINLAIKNTFSWYPKLVGVKETEEFYIKVFDPANRLYIPNSKEETKHACFLKMNKKIASQEIKPPTNLSPLKTGEADKNKERYELCRFEIIEITENKKTPIRLFDNGENLKNESNPKTPILKTILFDFEKYDITPEAKTILDNVLQYLLGYQHSYIKIDGHACVIGKEQYNQKLSQQRSDAVKKIFVDGGLDSNRIVSVGRGEVNPTDDKNGRDNIKHKNEKEYIENRRVDITFDSYGHDAQTIIFETIAPSDDQNLTIDITEYQNKACFREKGKHRKNIKINSTEYSKAIDVVTNKLDFPVKSNLSQFNLFPLQYIWPKYNLTKLGTKSFDSANNYLIHVHSCRYFSDDSNPTILVKVYPDIKWDILIEYACKNPIAYRDTWVKMRQARVTDAVNKAQAADIDGYDGDLETTFKFGLAANWNNEAEHFELTKEWEGKIGPIIVVFLKVKKKINSLIGNKEGNGALKKLPDVVKRKCSAIARIVGRQPVMLEVISPGISLQGSWSMVNMITTAKGAKRPHELGTKLELQTKFNPLIGGKGTIDVVAVAEKIPEIGQIIEAIEIALGILSVQLTFAISLIGEISAFVDISGFYTSNQSMEFEKCDIRISGKVGFEVILKIEGSWDVKKFILLGDDVKVSVEASAKAESYLTPKLGIGADEIGPYLEASISFEGIYLTLEIKGTFGKSSSSRSHKITIVEKPTDPIFGGRNHFVKNEKK